MYACSAFQLYAPWLKYCRVDAILAACLTSTSGLQPSRNELQGAAFSLKMSTWLRAGCAKENGSSSAHCDTDSLALKGYFTAHAQHAQHILPCKGAMRRQLFQRCRGPQRQRHADSCRYLPSRKSSFFPVAAQSCQNTLMQEETRN